jgi:HD-GYP domain-containing protein (c-di-GMP phosphodiesterase class II)
VLILPTEEARPGMKLAAPVQHPDQPGQVLLKGGYILEPDVIRRMHDMRIPMIFIDYPALEELDKHLAPYLSPARQEIYSQIKKSLGQSQKSTQAKVNYNDYCDSTRGLIETLLTQGKHPLFLDQMSRQGGDMVGHATSVAHLALLLGIRLENYLIDQRKRLPCSRAKDIVGLGVAGMLHDIGKTELPPNVAESWETNPPETQADLDLYMSHVRLGYDKIHGEVEPTASSAVLHHHQHFDGSGFPNTPQADGANRAAEGQRIHIFARILHAADLYDRLATTATGERRSNLEVYFQMRTSCSGWCDPVVVQVLQQIAPPFPPGSRLALSDGTAAIVTQTNTIDPFKPVVRRVVGEDLKIDGDAFDLGMNGSPKVVKVGKTVVEPFLPVAA